MLTILPSTVWTSVAHPTEQYGQTLGTVFAFLMRSSWARASAGARLAPRPASPPRAVPVALAAAVAKNPRREMSMVAPPVFLRGMDSASVASFVRRFVRTVPPNRELRKKFGVISPNRRPEAWGAE